MYSHVDFSWRFYSRDQKFRTKHQFLGKNFSILLIASFHLFLAQQKNLNENCTQDSNKHLYCILYQNINFLYFVSRSFGLMTALIRLDKLPVKVLQYSSGVLRIQTNLIALIRARIFGRNFSATLFLTTVRKFSIGLRLGLFPDHFRKVILLAPKNSVKIYERWHSAPSCIKILQSCTDMCSCSLSLIKFKYFQPFIVFLVLEKSVWLYL